MSSDYCFCSDYMCNGNKNHRPVQYHFQQYKSCKLFVFLGKFGADEIARDIAPSNSKGSSIKDVRKREGRSVKQKRT